MRNDMNIVFLWVLHNLVTTFENPKLPFDARNKTIKEPKRPHTKMIQTFSETSLSSIDAQLAKKLLGPHKKKAAIIEPIIRDSVHLFVSTDVTMIAKTIISAINPVFIFYECNFNPKRLIYPHFSKRLESISFISGYWLFCIYKCNS